MLREFIFLLATRDVLSDDSELVFQKMVFWGGEAGADYEEELYLVVVMYSSVLWASIVVLVFVVKKMFFSPGE